MPSNRKAMASLPCLASLGCVVALSGCGTMIKQASTEIEQTVRAMKVTLPVPGCTADRVAPVSAALTTRSIGAGMSAFAAEQSPRGQAARMLAGATNQAEPKLEMAKILAAMSPVQGPPNSLKLVEANTSIDVHVSRSELGRELEEMARTAQAGGFAQLAEAQGAAGIGAGFFATYFGAYFRQGQLLTFGIDQKSAKTRLSKDLARAMGQDYDKLKPSDKKTVDDAVDAMLKTICKDDKCALWSLADEDAAFITRAGQKFAFPVITVDLAPGTTRGFTVTKIDEVAVVGDVTRVFVEALFDATQPNLPAIDKATGCTGDTKLLQACQAQADKKLNAINKSGDVAEAIASYVGAQAIRGGWLVSLNNEAVAKLVTTFISVSARKGTELAVWAGQSCGNDANALGTRSVKIIIDL
jgi:cell pole-organizing protein PopZ